MPELQEKHLIQGIRLNDRVCVERFVKKYYDKVLVLVRHRVGKDCEDCRDLACEIIWQAIAKVKDGGYVEEKGQIEQYLFGIISNSCKNYFKARKNNPLIVFSDLNRHHHPSDFLESVTNPSRYEQELRENRETEVRAIVESAVGMLDAKHRELVYLMYYQELSYEEISRRENLSLSKVKSRLFEARRKLEQIVHKKLNGRSNLSS